jgi:CelD/BcsL family acetyltransferase involved in cellulose biosynthesis
VTFLEKIPEDPDIALAWNNLVSKMERPEVFYTHQWALAASRAFSTRLRILTFLIYDSFRLVGVAAMAANWESPSTLFFLTASTADYCDIVSEPQTRSAVLEALFDETNRIGVLNLILANTPADSHTLRAIGPIARANKFHLHQRRSYDCGIISLGDQKQRQVVLQSAIRKERERRGLKKLKQLGPIRLVHLGPEQLETGLNPIFDAQISRFLATNRLSPLIRPERLFFLKELAKLLGLAGWLKISQLEVNGQPIAWNYGFRFSDSWFWYLPTFETQFEDSSPGSCLLRLIIEEACGDVSVSRLDLGLGDEAYKARFTNATSATRYLRLSKSTPRHLAVVGRHRLAAFAETYPAVEKRMRATREIFRAIQNRIHKTGTLATVTHTLTRARSLLRYESEVAFFEAPQIKLSENDSLALRLLTREEITSAAISNAEDDQTLAYLIRSSQRLRQGGATGYFLQEEGAHACHFLWADLYNDFYLSEINSRLESGDPQAMMIFDCWTPVLQRGHGHYARAIRLAAARFQEQQKAVWIFSAAKNESSVSGIVKAGFVYRFSLVHSRTMWRSTLSRHEGATSQFRTVNQL